MERFHDMFGHPHELVVRGGCRRVLRHKVANGLCGVAETGRERYRGALDKVFWGERPTSGKLCHDVGEQEGEVVQVLLGRSGSQEGIELALWPPVIEAKELVAPMGAGLRCVQLQLLKRLGDRVEAGGVERLDGGRNLHQLSLHRNDEVQVPKTHAHA